MGESKKFYILTVNPGSTSTKVSLFENESCIDSSEIEKKTVSGVTGEAFDREVQSYIDHIEVFMAKSPQVKLDAIVGRGGFINREKSRVEGGVYNVALLEDGKTVVCDDIVRGVTEDPEMDHASNLGIPIVAKYAQQKNIRAFTVDPVVADDFPDVARFSGHKDIERKSIAHVLSLKAMGTKAARGMGKTLDEVCLVGVHMGGGITVAALRNGKMVDNTLALLGEGPFTPQRTGGLPIYGIVDMCYSGKYTKKELLVEFAKKGGLMSYLNEDSGIEIEKRIQAGDDYAKLVMEAMAYQVAKDIGGMSIAAGGKLDAVVLSGGLANSKRFMEMIRQWIEPIAPIIIYKENVEMDAMAMGAYKVLNGSEAAKDYILIK